MSFALLCYCIAIETIDGKGNGPLHTPSALFFFIIMEIGIVYITLFLHRLYEWDTSVLSRSSLKLK
jgi:hypothetical protein